VGDILFRIYYNQNKNPKPNEVYCFEVLTRNGYHSKYAGRYVSEHPQAPQDVLEKLLDEANLIQSGILEISNELDGYNPKAFTPDSKDWFNCAITNAVKGDRKYKNLELVGA
jgi:hypothetical protein